MLMSSCFLFDMATFAHDQFPPDWRGQDGTTFQSFSFDDDTNPAAMNNAFGQTTVTITVGNPNEGVGWLDSWFGFPRQQGFWNLASDGQIELLVDNQPTGDNTLVYIQLYYVDFLGSLPTVEVDGGQPFESENWQTVIVDTDEQGLDHLVLEQRTYMIAPSSQTVRIFILTDPLYGALIDHVIVDTKATPAACIVNFNDLVILCQEWLQSGPDLQYDLNDSGKVDMVDFSTLAFYWQQVCPW